jgi:hypothetical protein
MKLTFYQTDDDFIKNEITVAIEETFEEIAAKIIPIYTRKRPNPKSGEADCPITTREKERFRALMKTKLEAAQTEEELQKVIDHYKEKWSE